MSSRFQHLEALFWLGRPASMFGKTPPVLAGYLVGSPDWRPLNLVLITVLAVCMQLIVSSLNDVYDAPKDGLTAPYLPIPSGLLTRRQAAVAPLAAGMVLVLTLVALGEDANTFLLIGITACLGVGIGGIYGETKSSPWSPLLASTGSVGAVLWGWILSERVEEDLLFLVLVAMVLHGVFMNLINQLRDIEKDPEAGNYTVGARRGWRATLALASSARLLECVSLVFLAASLHAPARGGAVIFPLVALAYGVYIAVSLDPSYRPGRLGSESTLGPFRLSTLLAEIALLFVISPGVAVAVGIPMWSWYHLLRPIYDLRIVQGGLLRNVVNRA